MIKRITPIFTFLGIVFAVCCIGAAVGVPPVYAGIVAGALGVYYSK